MLLNRRQLLGTVGVALSAGCLRANNNITEQSTQSETISNQIETQTGTSTPTEPSETEPLDDSARQLWEVPYTVNNYTQHVYSDSGVLLGTVKDTFAFVGTDGDVQWTQSAGEGSKDTATWPAAAGNKIFLADQETAFALDTATGQMEWQTPLPIEINSPSAAKTQAVVSSGVALIGFNYKSSTEDDRRAGIAGFDADTGELLWHRSHNDITNNWDSWLGIQSLSPPINGRTIIGGWNNVFWINVATGEFRDDAYVKPRYRSVRANGSLYFIDRGRVLAATISDSNVREDWEFDPLGRASSPVAVADSQVYMAADDTGIYAVEDGKRVWRYQADNTVRSVPAVTRDTVWAGENKLYMIDRDSGAGKVVADDVTPKTASAFSDTALISDEGRTVAYQRQT